MDYDEYLSIVAADDGAHRTGRTLQQANNLIGDELREMLKDSVAPAEAADEIIAAAAED